MTGARLPVLMGLEGTRGAGTGGTGIGGAGTGGAKTGWAGSGGADPDFFLLLSLCLGGAERDLRG